MSSFCMTVRTNDFTLSNFCQDSGSGFSRCSGRQIKIFVSQMIKLHNIVRILNPAIGTRFFLIGSNFFLVRFSPLSSFIDIFLFIGLVVVFPILSLTVDTIRLGNSSPILPYLMFFLKFALGTCGYHTSIITHASKP